MSMASQKRHESPELGSAVARLIRALVDRAADGDHEALEQLAALELLIPRATTLAGHSMHGYGYSHAELAAILGVSRQASVKRFGAALMSLDDGHWLAKRTSSGALMRDLVARLTTRRSA